MKASLARKAQLDQARETSLTMADESSLTSGQWEDDARRVTLGRLFYIDLPIALKLKARGFGKSDRETLKTDALLWIVGREQARNLPLGPSGKTPLRRDWLDSDGTHGLSAGAWQVLEAALRAAAESPTEYARLKTAKRELPTDLWTDEETRSVADAESMRAYADGWQADYAPAWTASDLGRAMGLSKNAARTLERAHLGMSDARCAHEWGIGMEGVKKIVQRGRKELATRYPEPSDLREAVLAANAALVAMREDAARETILDYRSSPDDAAIPVYGPRNKLAAEADLAANEYLAYARNLPLQKRAMLSALTRLLTRGETDPVKVADRAHLLADGITRQLAAERLREAENVRKGRRGILAGKFDSASDAPLPPGLERKWSNAEGEDSEIRANRAAVAQIRAERESGDYFPARPATEADHQRWHERQKALAIAQALDASYSASFKPKPSAHGRALLLADQQLTQYLGRTGDPESEPTQ